MDIGPARYTFNFSAISHLKIVISTQITVRMQYVYGDSWAMAQFILATETKDENERNARMYEIRKYNEEDLAATWAVFEWLLNK